MNEDMTTTGPRLRDMTQREEEQNFTRFVAAGKLQRFCILEAFEGKAHKVLGYNNFEEYCKDRLGLSYSKTYLSSLVKATIFEREIMGKSFNILKLSEIEQPQNGPNLTLSAALEITKLPREKWADAYAEFSLRDEHGDRTQSSLQAELKRIVKRKFREGLPQQEAAPETAPEPPRKKPNMTPIVPEVYDKGEGEQLPSKEAASPSPVSVEPSAAMPASAEPNQAEVEDDPVRVMLFSFVRVFVNAYQQGDSGAMLELFHDARKFLAEYDR